MVRTALCFIAFPAVFVSVGCLKKGSSEAASSPNPTASIQKSALPDTCSTAEYHQLDFWIGDWDVFEVDKPGVTSAHVRVDLILDGCVLHEQYEDPTGSKGESFSVYDATRRVWHQTWVTNHGRLLTIEGNFAGGQMVMQGADRTVDGKDRRVRGVWKAVPGGVRETAVTSMDDGKTWQPWFDLMFRNTGMARVGIVAVRVDIYAEHVAGQPALPLETVKY